jgi:predicted nuclease of restriction endonuclease-like (RecB) superfamily
MQYLPVRRNWLLGKRIVEEELGTNRKGNYGKEIIISVSKKLTEEYGKGFERSSVYSFVQFYKEYKDIFQTASGQSFLSWSHYLVLLQVFDKEARDWYESEALRETWSVRTLQRNVSTQYYYRILKSQKKDLVRKEMLSKSQGEGDERLEFVKNPAILEFLSLPEDNSYLEKAILANLKDFLMELGKGYAFVASQKRIHTEKEDYFIDLVFYNYILKGFVLIDLKMGKITHQDVGQMDMYVKMFDEREKGESDNPTIGILLCSDTDADVARYSNLSENNHLFASKYKTYLPTQAEIKAEIENQKAMFYLQNFQKK